jgi:hypothetical protein
MMENGVGNNARFKFNMFKWKSRTSYIYMHCEVYLCDSDKEECYNEVSLENARSEAAKPRCGEFRESAFLPARLDFRLSQIFNF